MRVLVTGASGVLGGGLARKMHELGHEVIGVCRRSVPWPVEWEMLRRDLTTSLGIFSLPYVDCIIHAAGYAQPIVFTGKPFETIAINTWTTERLFDRLNPGGKFMFVSSAQIYAPGSVFEPKHPRACYVESKRCGEVITWLKQGRGFKTKVVRPALVYGPGSRAWDRRVMYDFISRGLRDKIIVHGEGLAMRTYCYVDDACKMIDNVLNRGTRFGYNIGGVSRVSIRDLAKMIGKKMGKEVQFVPGEIARGAPDDECVDIRDYEEEFGRMEFTPIDKGLDETIKWVRRIHGLETSK